MGKKIIENDTTESEGFVDENMLKPKWFALQTLSNQENKVKTAIEVAIKEKNLSDVVFEILVPTEKVVEIKGGRKFSRTKKFYPGYVFIKMKRYAEDGEILEEPFAAIRGVNGVVRFVGDREPVELQQREIDDILDKVKAVSDKVVPKSNYEVGDLVKIGDGPFLNLTGTIEGIDTENGRLRVNVLMFGRSTPVDLEFWQVKRADNES